MYALLLRLFGTVLLGVAPATAVAQGLPLAIPVASPDANYGFPIKRVGNFDTAPIIFEGQRLFTIAAPAGNGDNAVPAIVQRVDTIQDNLRRIVPVSIGGGAAAVGGTITIGESRFDADTFVVEVGKENGYPTLYATDGKHRESAPIMTLTDADATLSGLTSTQLAQNWRAILQSALGPALLAIQPEYFAAQLKKMPFVLAGAAALTWLLSILRKFLRKRGRDIDEAAARIDDVATADTSEAKRLRLVNSMLEAAPWLVTWFVVALWVLVFLWMLSVFPGTRGYANALSSSIVKVIVLWLAVAIFDRFLGIAIIRLSDDWAFNPFSGVTDRARLMLRRPTIVRALENLKSIVLFAVAAGWTLSIFAISTASVLTIGAIAAFAISFAAQSIIKDYVNGFLILAEDQFAIGDYVTINGVSGSVENLSLRITQVRTDDGKLVTIPNSTIAAVENATRSWSRIDFRVSVATDSNIEKALATLQAALEDLADDPKWKPYVLEAPKVLGVDSVSHAGIVLRAWIKIAPSERGPLSREVNRRVEEAFRQNSVSIAIPQTTLVQPQVQIEEASAKA